MTEDPDNVWDRIKDLKGIDQFITKNWDYWHLMKFVTGYERWKLHEVRGMSEMDTINYTIPQTLRAFGFPTQFVYIDPKPLGVARYEWVVSLPDYIAEKLKSEFGDKIIIGQANKFGLYLVKDGLLKDGIEKIFGFSGAAFIGKNGEIGSMLVPTFSFYYLRK